ncbi:MAG: 2-oxoglutarate dehydrogenase E1 component [Chthoniobacteraceae bacterium]
MALFFANQANAQLIDQNYEAWRNDPASVDSTWSAFFEGFELGSTRPGTNGAMPAQAESATGGDAPLQTRVDGLVYGYRTLGHTIARTDPLAKQRPENPLMRLGEFGFSEKDLDLTVSSKFLLGGKAMLLREMVAKLEAIYSSNIGFEFMHIQNPKVRNWVREKIETRDSWSADAKTKTRMLRHLMKVEMFEHFLHTRFQGVKRFSVEGGESLISALDGVLENCPHYKVEELCMGMAHRGRLAVIVEFLKKPYSIFLKEFSPNYIPESVFGDGDVKYHLGYVHTRVIKPSGAEVEVRLSANPSHLEIVDPVVQGMARARQRIRKDTEDRSRVVPILLHGDAAFAGQGVVAEVLNMSQLAGYRVGGTIHIVINNQIGFTTLPEDARSTQYCTDVAKMIEAPIFHVNGDDPLAVRYCAELAFEFRQTFKRDVVIDLVCYRRHGHNEVDEPAYTQPTLYDLVDEHASVAKIFQQRLIDDGTLTAEKVQALEKELLGRLETALAESKTIEGNKFTGSTAVQQPDYNHEPVETAVPKEALAHVVQVLTTPPADFHVNSKLKRFFLEKRAQVFAKGEGFDWSFGEALAWGSLLIEGVPVRLSGQDCRRGTFTQRHAYLYDDENRDRWCALKTLADEGGTRICIYNSLLSEAAVLGFDYGYSLNYPRLLCMWEAQFGDFVNGAQVVIDQFIASAESKWQRVSGIVLLLPHGYEGQGPEHSSARLERFLQLCAEKNIEVANLTTPAQYFHILRRQMKREFKKPLVLMTPKSMLRLEAAASKLEDFTSGRFHEIIGDATVANPKSIKRVVLSAGKVFYDLLNFRTEQKIGDTAFIRVEQLYPLHDDALTAELAKYPNSTRFVWCQEEPQNMGAWNFMMPRLRELLDAAGFADKKLRYAGRKTSASTAVGSKGLSDIEQKKLIEQAFTV